MEKITSQELKDALDDSGNLMLDMRQPLRDAIASFIHNKYGKLMPDLQESLLDRVSVHYSVDDE